MYGEKDALHDINKVVIFLEKMKEWGVEVEGLPKGVSKKLKTELESSWLLG